MSTDAKNREIEKELAVFMAERLRDRKRQMQVMFAARLMKWGRELEESVS
jgi:hypothetical protein